MVAAYGETRLALSYMYSVLLVVLRLLPSTYYLCREATTKERKKERKKEREKERKKEREIEIQHTPDA